MVDERVIDINAKTFPDDKFRALVLKEYDADGNRFLSTGEIACTWVIDIEGDRNEERSGDWQGIGAASIKGIEYFTEVTTLYMRNNRVTSVDLSKNTKLKELYCSGNPCILARIVASFPLVEKSQLFNE